jgi:Arc/MetJ family transcription regulator
MCKYLHMATNLALDDQLIEDARRAGSHRSKKEAVTAALEEYVRKRQQMRILEAFGTFPADADSVDPDYDYKSERQRNAAPTKSGRRRRQ